MLIETNTEAAMRLLDRSEIGAPETVTPSEYRKILRKRAGIGVKPFLAIIGILILSAALMALALVVEDSSLKLIVLAALVVGILVSLYFGTRKYLSDLYFMPCYAFIKNGSRCLLNEAVADNRYPLKVRGQDVFVRVRYHVDSFNAAQSGMKAFYFERLLMLHDKRITFVAMRSDFDRDTLNAEIAFYTSIKDEKKLAEIVRSKFSPESSRMEGVFFVPSGYRGRGPDFRRGYSRIPQEDFLRSRRRRMFQLRFLLRAARRYGKIRNRRREKRIQQSLRRKDFFGLFGERGLFGQSQTRRPSENADSSEKLGCRPSRRTPLPLDKIRGCLQLSPPPKRSSP